MLADTLLRGRAWDESAACAAKQRTKQVMKTALSSADYARLKTELELEIALLGGIDESAYAQSFVLMGLLIQTGIPFFPQNIEFTFYETKKTPSFLLIYVKDNSARATTMHVNKIAKFHRRTR